MLYGKRIRLRAPEREDIPSFVRWLNDPEVRSGLLQFLPMSMAAEENWFDDMMKRPQAEHPLCIEIQTEGSWRLIGNLAFFNFDWRVRSAEVGILIGEKACWDQGYGTEAMQLLLQHGFMTLNLNRISLWVFANNPRAIRAYEKAGFQLEGRQRQGMFKNGAYIDVLLMGVLKDDYKNEG